jgi:hypothetical protein
MRGITSLKCDVYNLMTQRLAECVPQNPMPLLLYPHNACLGSSELHLCPVQNSFTHQFDSRHHIATLRLHHPKPYYHDNKNQYPSVSSDYSPRNAHPHPVARSSYSRLTCSVRTYIYFLRFGRGTSLVGRGDRDRLFR